MSVTTETTEMSRPSIVQTLLFRIVWVFLIALYIFEVAAAIGNWQGMTQIAEALSDGLSTTGMVWLAVGIAAPVIALGAAVITTRRKSRPMQLLVLVLGLTLVAICKLNLLYLIPTTSYLSELPL